MLLVLKGVAVGRLLKWPAWGIVALSLLLNTLGLWYGLPYPRPPQWLPDDAQTRIWTHDTIGPVGPLAAARDKFSWGRWSQQDFVRPLAHYMLLAAAYSPYIGYLFLSGGFEAEPTPAYPYGLSDPTTALTVLTLISRAVSALMGTGIVYSRP
jgi:hypothetical protein